MKVWTAPGPNMIHVYWLKYLTEVSGHLAPQIRKLLTAATHPDWLTQGKTILITAADYLPHNNIEAPLRYWK